MPDGGPALWCSSCKPDNSAVKVPSAICKECCVTSTGYGPPGSKRRIWCGSCAKTRGGVQLCGVKCTNCDKQANFGLLGQKKASWCSLCVKTLGIEGAVNLSVKRCKCGEGVATINETGGTSRPVHCRVCAEKKGLVDTTRCRQCWAVDSRASHGFPPGKARLCAACAVNTGAIEFLKGRCVDCWTVCASYGMANSGRQWCKGCAESHPGAVKLKTWTRRCKICQKTTAAYNIQGQTTPLWCKACGEERGAVKVKIPQPCVSCGERSALYNTKEATKPQHCGKCRQPGEVNVVGPICEHEGCTTMAKFNVPPLKKGRWCSKHRPHDSIDVVNRTCATPGCSVYVAPCYQWCASCDTDPTRRTRVRENIVNQWLLEEGLQYTSWDKKVPEGSSCGGNFRPDFVYDMSTHVIALEVDENAHRASSYDCENRRVLDIFNSYGGSAVVFIRYNPDTPTFPNKQREGFIDSYRKEVLFSVLRQAMNTVPEHHLTVHRVFYPNDTGDILTSGWVDPCQPEYTETDMAPLVQVPPYGSARYQSKRARHDGPSDSSQSSAPSTNSSLSPAVPPTTNRAIEHHMEPQAECMEVKACGWHLSVDLNNLTAVNVLSPPNRPGFPLDRLPVTLPVVLSRVLSSLLQ